MPKKRTPIRRKGGGKSWEDFGAGWLRAGRAKMPAVRTKFYSIPIFTCLKGINLSSRKRSRFLRSQKGHSANTYFSTSIFMGSSNSISSVTLLWPRTDLVTCACHGHRPYRPQLSGKFGGSRAASEREEPHAKF